MIGPIISKIELEGLNNFWAGFPPVLCLPILTLAIPLKKKSLLMCRCWWSPRKYYKVDATYSSLCFGVFMIKLQYAVCPSSPKHQFINLSTHKWQLELWIYQTHKLHDSFHDPKLCDEMTVEWESRRDRTHTWHLSPLQALHPTLQD